MLAGGAAPRRPGAVVPPPVRAAAAHGVRAEAAFRAAPWLVSGHLQTVWAALARRAPAPALARERIELPDGDFVDLDWTGDGDGPVVVIVHGLAGSSASPYMRGMLAAVAARGWRGAALHLRGCSGAPNRLDRTYHSGDTGDLDHVVGLLRARSPRAPLAVVGYSLGGNVVLRWLAERGDAAPVAAAAAVSVPYDLAAVADRMARGVSRLYMRRLVGELKRVVEGKFAGRADAPVDLAGLRGEWTFRGFDDRVTAPLHGFRDAADYYARASARPVLGAVRRPTLAIHALDDPFTTPAVVPAAAELAPAIRLEVSARGGHVGFVAGAAPWRARYWLEARIPAFLAGYLDARAGTGTGSANP